MGGNISEVIGHESIRQIRRDMVKCIRGQMCYRVDNQIENHIDVTVWDFVNERILDEFFTPVEHNDKY